MANDTLNRLPVAVNHAIASGATYTTNPIDIAFLQLKGNVTLQIEVTGDGTLATSFLVSNSWSEIRNPSGDFVKPVSGYTITNLSTFTKTSGTGSDGKDQDTIPVNNAQALKFSFAATNDSIVLNAWVSAQ